jgi:glycosyltransferase involved in cell wall biosynthesis
MMPIVHYRAQSTLLPDARVAGYRVPRQLGESWNGDEMRRLHVGINSLFLIPAGVGGSETYLRNLVHELPGLDPTTEYTVFTNRENAGSFDFGEATTIHEVRCPVRAVRRPERIAYEYTLLPMQAARHRTDILFSPGFTAPARRSYASVVNILDMQLEDMPENVTPLYRLVHTRLMRRSVRTASHILTLSEHAKRRIVAVYGVPPEKVTVSYLAAEPIYFERVHADDLARVRHRYGLRAPYILSVATLHTHKNLGALIEAYAAMREEMRDDIQLALVGLRGTAAIALEAKIRAAGLENQIALTGWVPDADLPALYRGASVYVLPSRYEGFGIPVLEAMASGVPVITTTAASLPEVAGDAAILIDPDDRTALVTALRRVLTDEQLRAGLIARGHTRAQRFTWRKTAQTTLSVFQEVARNRVSRSSPICEG